MSAIDWSRVRAALLDLDGVITPTAEVHVQAWARMFTAYFAERGVRPYAAADYYDSLDGKPRYDGVQTLLTTRGIELPYGDPNDPPTAETVCGLGNRKDAFFAEILSQEGIQAYPGSLRLLDFLDDQGIAKAVVSSSKNARGVLAAAGIEERFAVIVDGLVAAELGLPGKPAPDTFQFAARQLGVPAEQAIVVEDALSGVRAGAAGGFGLVIGVDRGTGASRLREAGAKVVVTELDELI